MVTKNKGKFHDEEGEQLAKLVNPLIPTSPYFISPNTKHFSSHPPALTHEPNGLLK